MPHFSPPTVYDDPPFDAETEDKGGTSWRLYRYMVPRVRGVNVYQTVDAVGNIGFCQDVATAENSNTQIPPYPLMPDQGKQPNIIARDIVSPDKPEVTVLVYPYITHIFWGGHTETITAAQQTLLTNYTAHGTGYGAWITP